MLAKLRPVGKVRNALTENTQQAVQWSYVQGLYEEGCPLTTVSKFLV